MTRRRLPVGQTTVAAFLLLLPLPAHAQQPAPSLGALLATRPVVRAESIARPVARPAAGDSRAPNLFQRITGAFSAPKAAAPMAPTQVEPSVVRAAPAPENVVAVAPKPAPRPAAAQPSMNLDVTERAKPPRDDDDLQIPAFLRRQAN